MAMRWRAAGRAALDLLYPPVCVACGAETADPGALCAGCFRDAGFIAGPVCDRCGAPSLDPTCDGCAHAPPAWDRGRAAALYAGAARRAALALKHADRLDVARAAAPWLLRAGRALVAEADLIAPVPLHWTRLWRRRFNQSAELARALAAVAERRQALALDLLTRTRRTGSQDGRTRVGRFANVAGAFAVRRRWRGRLDGARVLLIDDVMTTGATLSACAEALRAAGASGVDALVLARVARDAESGI
jgi:ComF family protein